MEKTVDVHGGCASTSTVSSRVLRLFLPLNHVLCCVCCCLWNRFCCATFTRRRIQVEKGSLVDSWKGLNESLSWNRFQQRTSHNAQSCCSFSTWIIMINLKERQQRSRLDFFSYMVLTGTGRWGGTFIEGPCWNHITWELKMFFWYSRNCLLPWCSVCVRWLKEEYDEMPWTPGSTGTSKHFFLIHDVWWEREMTERGGRGERKAEAR